MEVREIGKEKEIILSYRKIAFKYITVYEEKSNHHSDLIDNIKETLLNKLSFTDSFKQTDSLFKKSAVEELEKMNQTQKKNNEQAAIQKKNLQSNMSKTLNERCDEMNDFYNKLQETVMDTTPDFTKTKEFQKFKEMNEKNVELRV